MALSTSLQSSGFRRSVYVSAGLVALALLLATSTWYRIEDWPNAPAFLAVLAWQALTWMPWLGLAMVVDRVAAIFPMEKTYRRDVTAHVIAAVLLAGVHTGWFVLVSTWLSPLSEMPDTKYGVFQFFFLFWFQLNLVLYGAIAGLSMSHRYQQRAREREQRAAEMELRWIEAQLESLRLQIRPHFLFNTLNTLVVMQRKGEVDKARETTEALAEILRTLLRSEGDQETPLRAERTLVERYLFIEQRRFGDRLQVRWDVEQGIEAARLPSLALQTLVENAVRVGAGGQEGPCRIDIRIRRHEDRLEVTICNPAGDDVEGLGIGLDNTRARLAALYGDAQELQLADKQGRVCIRMSLPYHEEPMQ